MSEPVHQDASYTPIPGAPPPANAPPLLPRTPADQYDERLALVLNTMSDGLVVFDREWRYLCVNPQAARLLRRSPEELLGRCVWEAFPEVVDRPTYEHLQRAMEQRTPVEFEACARELDLCYRARALPTPEGLALFFTDITAEKRAREAQLLRERRELRRQLRIQTAVGQSAAMLRAVLDTVPVSVFWKDRQSLYLGCNRHFAVDAGLPSSEHVIGKDDFALPWRAQAERYRADDQEVMRTGIPRLNYEESQTAPDGRPLLLRTSKIPLRDSQGNIVGVLGTYEDITAQRAAQQLLHDQNRRLELLQQAAAQLLAGSPKDILPALYERIAEDFQVDVYFEFRALPGEETLELVASRGLTPEMQHALRRLPFGETVCGRVAQQCRPMICSQVQQSPDPLLALAKSLGLQVYACHPLLVDQRLIGVLSFGSTRREHFSPEDLEFLQVLANYVATARERARLLHSLQDHSAHLEQAIEERTASLREMVAELEHLSYSMVHNMRAPLRAIQGFAQLCLMEEGPHLTAGTREWLDRMIAAARSMDQLVVDALNYTKILREHLPLEPVDPEQLLRNLLATQEKLQPPHAQVRLRGPFPPLLANEGALALCFSHLLDNAVKFVPPGRQPHVEISAQTVAADGSPALVRLCVADNGVGIPPHQQSRLFSLFERQHGPEVVGTGTGLAMVRKMLERMHGRIWVESASGQGSRFWLELPAAPSAPPP